MKSKLLLCLSGITLLLLAWAGARLQVVVPAPAPAETSAEATLFPVRGGRRTALPTVSADQQRTGSSMVVRDRSAALPDDSAPDLDQLVDRIPLADVPMILQGFGQDANPTVREFEMLLVRKWAEGSSAAAAAWATQLPPGEDSGQALLQVVLGWAEADLPGALQWIAGLSESETKGPIMLAAAYEAARTQPMIAIELGRNLSDDAERERLLVYAARQWAATDSSAAAAWAAQVTDVSLRERLLAAILVAAAASSPHDAATLLANRLVGHPEQARAAVAIVQQWAQVNPAEASRWVASFPEDDTGTAAVENLVRLWSLRDGPAADAWARDLPEGKLREAGRLALAEPAVSPSR